jgi:hypothetical protein
MMRAYGSYGTIIVPAALALPARAFFAGFANEVSDAVNIGLDQ